jgi:hypothetical protein
MLKTWCEFAALKFGNLMLLEGDAFRTVAPHGRRLHTPRLAAER